MSGHNDNFYEEAQIWEDDSHLGAPDLISRLSEQRFRLISLGVILALAIGIAGVFASGEGLRGLIWLTIGALGLVGLGLLTRFLEWGLAAFFAGAWVLLKTPGVAQGQGGGGEQGLALSQIGLLALLAAWLVRSLLEQRGRFRSLVNPPIAAYLFLCVWSTVHSLLFPDEAVQRAGGVTAIQVNVVEIILRFLALGGLVMVAQVTSVSRNRLLAAGLVTAGVVLFTFTLIPPLARFLPGQGYGAFPQMLTIGVLAALVLNRIGPLWGRYVMAAVALGIFAWAFVKNAEWVSGWLAGGLALAIVAYVSQRKLFWAAVGVVALVVFLNASYFYEKVYVKNFYAGGQMKWGTASLRGQEIGALENDRSRMLRAAVLYADTFPLGIGLGNYKAYNKYYGSEKVWNTTDFTSAHGTYAQTLSELGWLGLVCLLWLQVALLKSLWRGYRALLPGWQRSYVLGTYAGCWGVFAAAFLGDYIFPAYHNGGMASFGGTVYVWLFSGLALGLTPRTAPQRTRPVPVAPLWNRPLPASSKGQS